jgi:hypothetical protein
MAVVEHKYIPDQMPAEELKRTFAARHALLDHVLGHLRGQIRAKTLSSFLLIGPRGAGKTTLVLMLCQSIREDPELAAAWLPLRFPEEQFGVCSLRDLLATAVRSLAEEGLPGAADWSSRVEAAADDEESQSLAVAALRDLARSQGKRLVFFVENLNLLLGRAFDETSQATFRRLLMVDPFLMLIGTAVQTFEQIEGYDKALFNYFHPLHLEKLDDDQMVDLLSRRAEYDENTAFLEELHEHRPKLRALARVTGGNPRFILMVYEILREGGVTDAVQVLNRLVDQLTPILKHVLEGLAPQQAKILDALMRAGGTATPAALAQGTRLKLNAVTSQLRRLRDNRMVDVLGGGKGQTAHYTVPDQLFCTWYQMRYLARKRRRIELFVEVIRLWFEAEERLEHVRRLAGRATSGDGRQARSFAETIEYFTAALRDTPLEDDAKRLMIQIWLCAGEVVEAAVALADLSPRSDDDRGKLGVLELVDLAAWCYGHEMLPEVLESARQTAEAQSQDLKAQLIYAFCLAFAEDYGSARDQFDRCLTLPIDQIDVQVALVLRVVASLRLSDLKTSLENFFSLALDMFGLRVSQEAAACALAVSSKWAAGDYAGVIADCSAAIEAGLFPAVASALPLVCRGFARLKLNDSLGATADLNEALALAEWPAERLETVFALLLHVVFRTRGPASSGSLVDLFVRAIELAPAPKQVEVVVNTSKLAAKPDARPFWAFLVRRMHEKLRPETAEAVAFLLPVADVLEGKGLTVLDSLPPQERAFALEVLQRFEPKGEKPGEPAGAETPSAGSGPGNVKE